MPFYIAIAAIALIGACIMFPGLLAIPIMIGIFVIFSIFDKNKFG